MRIFCLFVGWWLCVGCNVLQAQVPPVRQETELRTFPNGADYGHFDGHGKLVFQELYQDDEPAAWHSTRIYYPQGSKQGVKLERDIAAMNVFLAAEIRQPETVRAFLAQHLWHFLSGNWGHVTPDIITPLRAEHDLNDYLVEADRYRATKIERAHLRAKLQSYARSGVAAVEGNTWTMDANVITFKGAVEHWLIKGTVAPFQIGSFLCELKEPAGTFAHLPVSGFLY